MATIRLALTLLGLLVATSAAHGSGRIGFSTDQEGSFDVFKTDEDGSFFDQLTDEVGQAHHPTVAPSGQKVIYEVGGALYMNDFDDPIGTPVPLGSGYEVNAARAYLNAQRDFRIIYRKGVSGHLQIFIATVDISEEELINEVQLTSASIDSFQPAFCGPSHFVWIRDDSYATELCYQEFNAQGAVGSPTCWFSGFGDGLEDIHPSCDSTGGTIAWARETEDPDPGYEGTHDIWTMTSGGSNPHAIQEGLDDETMPSWSPGDDKIVFSWNRIWPSGESHDYEIWTMDPDGTDDDPVTSNDGIDDTYPSWGPAAP